MNFSSYSAISNGGAISTFSRSNIIFDNKHYFTDNYPSDSGGAIHLNESLLQLRDSYSTVRYLKNKANHYGGALLHKFKLHN